MRSFIIVAAAALVIGTSAQADTFSFATGQDSSGKIQRKGTDAHWIVTQWQQNGTTFKLPRPAKVIGKADTDWGSQWIEKKSRYPSAWIAPDIYYGANGNFTLVYTFDLTGYNLATASFANLFWSLDDSGTLDINGHVVSSLVFGKWTRMHAFSIPAGDLVQGTNTLTITSVNSDYNYEGARVTGTLTISQ